MALPSERRNVPFRSLWGTDWQQPHEMLSHRQAKEGGEGFWDAEHLDGDRASRWIPHIASQPFLPTETILCALCTGEGQRRDSWIGGESRVHLDLARVGCAAADMPADVAAGSSHAKPQRSRAHGKRMQQHAYLARLLGGAALPLALPSQRTGTATADAGRIHHAQTAIGFSAPLMGNQRLASRTAQGAI